MEGEARRGISFESGYSIRFYVDAASKVISPHGFAARRNDNVELVVELQILKCRKGKQRMRVFTILPSSSLQVFPRRLNLQAN